VRACSPASFLLSLAPRLYLHAAFRARAANTNGAPRTLILFHRTVIAASLFLLYISTRRTLRVRALRARRVGGDVAPPFKLLSLAPVIFIKTDPALFAGASSWRPVRRQPCSTSRVRGSTSPAPPHGGPCAGSLVPRVACAAQLASPPTRSINPTVRRPGVTTYSSIVHRGFLMKARAQAALFCELRAWPNRPRRLLARRS
jgi:hypothetical protein